MYAKAVLADNMEVEVAEEHLSIDRITDVKMELVVVMEVLMEVEVAEGLHGVENLMEVLNGIVAVHMVEEANMAVMDLQDLRLQLQMEIMVQILLEIQALIVICEVVVMAEKPN